MIARIKNYLFYPRFHFSRFQFNLVALFFLTVGLVAGSYFALKGVTSLFATANSSVAKDTDTDFNQGTLTSTTISGSGTSAVVKLLGISGFSLNWAYRKKITFDNSAQVENLVNFPVLVKLNSSRIDYSKTQDSGQDIRFTDSDGTTLLPYEIEKWDETGDSFVWVKVPQIDASSNTDYIYMYYGNSSATDGQSATDVWDSNYVMIQHLKDLTASTTNDSTSNNNDGTKKAIDEPIETSGKIGKGQNFDGSNDYVKMAHSSSLLPNDELTVSAWIYSNTYEADWGMIAVKAETDIAPWQLRFNGTSRAPQLCINSGGTRATSNLALTNGNWYFVVGTYNKNLPDANIKIYINGVQKGATTYKVAMSGTNSVYIGARGDGYYFNGLIDEVRISNTAHSAAWIAASYKSETDAFNTFGSEEQNIASSGSWESATDSNVIDLIWNGGWGDGTAGSTAFSATVASVGTNNTITFFMKTAASISVLSSASYVELGTVSSGTTFTKTKAELDALGLGTGSNRYVQVKAAFAQTSGVNPQLDSFTISYLSDNTAPETNATSSAMFRSAGGTTVASNGWTNNSSPYFSWTAGSDSQSGVKGYCLYLGTDPNGNPATAKGLLGTSPVSTAGTACQFIVSGTSIDFATSSYKGGTWLSTSSNPYYLNIKVIDNSGNVYTGSSAQFQFRYDGTPPTNTSYINCASGSFSNVADMNFSWPTGGSSPAATDDNAGVLGWQYQINSTSGTWLGTTTESLLGVTNYIPTTESSRTLTEAQDGSSIVSGSNIVYFRTVDAAGNPSSDSTIRTCNLSYGGAAPAFDGLDAVTVTPTTNTSNSFALSWPAATATAGQSVAHYYYMVNTSPPSTLATLQGNASTYIDNGTSRTVAAGALANVNKGSNTVYVVAVDDADTPNYSPSNYITGTFTLNSTDPDNVGNLVASDSSIKSQSQWNVTLTWTAPSYRGAGNLTYRVYRSTDGSNFSYIGSTSGLSYVDNAPASTLYYYKVYTRDGASADSSGTNAVSITPTGKWTTAPTLDSGPTVSSITTKKATITWSTSRTSDSKVQYGTSSGSYGEVEPSNSSQVTSHSIQLTGLNPGTTYYYKAKWTDEDGNTGTSEEKSFTTASAPTVKDVAAKNIGLTSAIIEFTSKDASKVKIYYGTTTSFGGVKEISTSTSETTYTAELTGLLDGTKYYYKINPFDSENDEYEGTVLDFTTLPRPKISKVRIQQVANTAQPTILVTWTTNTEVSSIVTYYPQGSPSDARDEVNVALTKGEHRMIVRGLTPQTDYILVVKGRDKIGNEAVSDTQRLTTATDTRPPQISELNVEGAAIPPTTTTAQESTAQLIVSWNTDEPGTSQVEFGEGTGTTYSSKTQEDSNLTYNHLVIISGLTPSKVYHLRAISKDKAGNTGNSIDTVTITPKATENALNLVITNLQEAFGFIGGLRK